MLKAGREGRRKPSPPMQPEEKLLTLAEWTVKGHPESSMVESRNASLPSGDGVLSRSLDEPVSEGGVPELCVEPPACWVLCGH